MIAASAPGAKQATSSKRKRPTYCRRLGEKSYVALTRDYIGKITALIAWQGPDKISAIGGFRLPSDLCKTGRHAVCQNSQFAFACVPACCHGKQPALKLLSLPHFDFSLSKRHHMSQHCTKRTNGRALQLTAWIVCLSLPSNPIHFKQLLPKSLPFPFEQCFQSFCSVHWPWDAGRRS